MTRETYQRSLDALRADVIALGETVVNRFETALACLAGNGAIAQEVIDGDAKVNERYLDLESDCIDLFALQQPVAGDLRFIAASFKIITDLERIADLAVNLAEYSREDGREILPEIGLQTIGTDIIEMVEMAIDAYTKDDPETCFAIDEYDEAIDQRCAEASEAVVRSLIETDDMTDVEAVIDEVSRLLLTIRDLERVADHAVNIAARTLYMVENDDTLLY
jgi:phosphate transport system protein